MRLYLNQEYLIKCNFCNRLPRIWRANFCCHPHVLITSNWYVSSVYHVSVCSRTKANGNKSEAAKCLSARMYERAPSVSIWKASVFAISHFPFICRGIRSAEPAQINKLDTHRLLGYHTHRIPFNACKHSKTVSFIVADIWLKTKPIVSSSFQLQKFTVSPATHQN